MKKYNLSKPARTKKAASSQNTKMSVENFQNKNGKKKHDGKQEWKLIK
jgi:hypothetical protein